MVHSTFYIFIFMLMFIFLAFKSELASIQFFYFNVERFLLAYKYP